MTDDYLGWVTAGLTRADGSGELGRAITQHPAWWYPPEVELTGDRLAFTWRFNKQDGRWRPRLEPLLLDFVDLADEASPAYARFALKWGPLYLCPACNGLFGHRPSTACPESLSYWGNGEPLYESLNAWRQYSKAAKALLNLSTAHRSRNDEAVLRTWNQLLALDALPLPSLRRFRETGVERPDDAANLARLVDDWLLLAEVRLMFQWFDAEPELAIGTRDNSLLGEIGKQVASTICRGYDLTICDECGKLFVPSRKRTAGRRAFCAACRQKGAPQKHASRAYRSRRPMS